MSDFDLMMQRRKEENRMKRMKGKKSDSSFIGDADDSINSMLNRMKEAADADKQANIKRQAGISKLKMLNVRFLYCLTFDSKYILGSFEKYFKTRFK